MSTPSSINISSGEANRSGNDMEGPLLPQDRSKSEIDTTEGLRRKLQVLEKKHLELINQYNQDMSCYEKEIMKLKLALKRGEAFRQVLESEMSFARREDAHVQMYSAEDELCDAKAKLLELQVLNDKYQQKAAEAEKMFQSAQWQWEEEQQRFAVERDNTYRAYLTGMEFLFKEKAQTERACQEMSAVLPNMLRKLRNMEGELHGCSEILKLQADHLDLKNRQKERLVRELERELSILLDIFQSMADGHVIARHPDVPLEELPWREFCELLHENVETLILNFHKASKRISHLEYICKHKTDTMNSLQQNQEDAFAKMSGQLKAQEDCWQKEKQFLEHQNSNLLAEVNARAQECEKTAQKSRQKAYGLEQICEKLAHENNSMRNALSHAHKERSSLLAACALLSGALCPLYSRLCAMSSQRDILQDQANRHGLVNEKIRSLLYALPANMESNQDEERLRQRRAKQLIYVFRRSVIAILATNRLRALAQYSHSLFVRTDGSRGSTRVQVCVGDSRDRHHESSFKEEGVDCIEALDWLTSSNLYTAIINSFSELQDVLNKPDPNSWVSGHSLISPARNSFAKLMDNLSMLMETVQGKPCECRVYLEKDSLIQRLASGLHRANAQALEAGLYDRLPSTRNIAILQQEIFEFSQRLHTAEVESRLLRLQLEEFKWSFNEMQKDAEKAHRLQEQLNELQHSFSDATEELRGRDQALNHQKKLLKDMEQDRQRLWEALQEAEHALQQAAKDKALIINHMKAVDATLNAVRDRAVAPGAAAATLLPSLQLEILSEEAMRGRPEAAAFQHVLISFMGLYSLAAARVEALTIAREPLRVHFEPEAAVVPPAAAPDESFWLRFVP